MSLDDWDVVAEAKSPFSTRATDTPRSASSRAAPAPAIPPPTTTTSYSASSSGQGRPCTGSVAPTSRRGFYHLLAPSGAGLGAPRAPPRGARHHRTARRRRPSTSASDDARVGEARL